MNYRRLGKTGLRVSELSYGSCVTFSFQIGLDEAVSIMELAYENGVNFFDNAEAYASGESEIIMGKALKKLGITKGDRVIIYMPMIPEALVAMLACSRLGAIHSVVFGGFASNELAVRIDDCKPKIIVSASCGHEPNRIVEYKPLLDNAIKIASHQVERCIIYQREALNVQLIPE